MDDITAQAVLPATVLMRERTVRRIDQRTGIPGARTQSAGA